MVRFEDLPEIVSRKMTAKVIGKSVSWLQRRRHIPIYAPTGKGEYSRRQIELIVKVESDIYTAEYAYQVFQAEHDGERAQGAVAIARAAKRRARK